MLTAFHSALSTGASSKGDTGAIALRTGGATSGMGGDISGVGDMGGMGGIGGGGMGGRGGGRYCDTILPHHYTDCCSPALLCYCTIQ